MAARSPILAVLVCALTLCASAEARPQPGSWRYRIVASSFRAEMAAGGSQIATLTVRNEGRRAWPLVGPERIELHVDAPPAAAARALVGRAVAAGIEARPGASVRPGRLAVLHVRLAAPATPGTFVARYTLVRRRVGPLRGRGLALRVRVTPPAGLAALADTTEGV